MSDARYFIPAWAEHALRSVNGGRLPEGVDVMKLLPRNAEGVLPVRIRPRARYSALSPFLAVCIRAATRQHDPFPAAPQRHTWTSAAALLMSMETLERVTRLPLFNPI